MGRLLIVDHHRREALDLQQRVTHLGHTVLAIAASGPEALAQAAALRPDVALIELRLPGPVDGIQVGTQLWVQFEIPVIYVSAQLTAPTLQRLWPTCLAGVLWKHVKRHDLHTALEQALEHPSQRAANPCTWAGGHLPPDARHHYRLPPGPSAGTSR
jgi:DNA-binding NarL/FixJ family response regulator